MTRFYRPGKHTYDYPDLANIAMKRALDDSTVSFKDMEAVYVGYVYGDSCAGQKAVYTIDKGMTGVPIINVNNNCATGSTALYLANSSILGG